MELFKKTYVFSLILSLSLSEAVLASNDISSPFKIDRSTHRHSLPGDIPEDTCLTELANLERRLSDYSLFLEHYNNPYWFRDKSNGAFTVAPFLYKSARFAYRDAATIAQKFNQNIWKIMPVASPEEREADLRSIREETTRLLNDGICINETELSKADDIFDKSFDLTKESIEFEKEFIRNNVIAGMSVVMVLMSIKMFSLYNANFRLALEIHGLRQIAVVPDEQAVPQATEAQQGQDPSQASNKGKGQTQTHASNNPKSGSGKGGMKTKGKGRG